MSNEKKAPKGMSLSSCREDDMYYLHIHASDKCWWYVEDGTLIGVHPSATLARAMPYAEAMYASELIRTVVKVQEAMLVPCVSQHFLTDEQLKTLNLA